MLKLEADSNIDGDAGADRSSVFPTMSDEEIKSAIKELKESKKDLVRILCMLIRHNAWKKLGYKSFFEFCKHEIEEYSYSMLSRLKHAIDLHGELEPDVEFGAIPEHVYRGLLSIVEKDRKTVWDKAKEHAGGVDKIRCIHIQNAINDINPERKEKQARATKPKSGEVNSDPSQGLYEYMKNLAQAKNDKTGAEMITLLRGVFKKLKSEGIIHEEAA